MAGKITIEIGVQDITGQYIVAHRGYVIMKAKQRYSYLEK